MMAQVESWWRERTPREQLLLLVMLALAASIAAWLLAVRPLGDALEQAKTRYAQAVTEWAEVRGRVDVPPAPVQAPAPVAEDELLALVRNDAVEAGFFEAQIAARGPGIVDVAIPAARAPAALAWIAGLERRGAEVAELHAAANGDRTVRLRLRLRPRGRE